MKRRRRQPTGAVSKRWEFEMIRKSSRLEPEYIPRGWGVVTECDYGRILMVAPIPLNMILSAWMALQDKCLWGIPSKRRKEIKKSFNEGMLAGKKAQEKIEAKRKKTLSEICEEAQHPPIEKTIDLLNKATAEIKKSL